ncbi:PTPLA-domain-containing protein [Dacryopinax primogenitus]|uniref:Very-long-chain (3R)-3-hydroxyacyl-CoA dehydratase n=1 Tax=Dacryopinax primogenitus (strain DJM 731) TaxID=1858805 RepID=M5FVN1_DACPD|nr:PTPLA-domain-containing protein [Dacryopinax primogenitus]EJT97406.1 PTPLA-domain-containing protein [Dacryopinax primogenitus]
MAGRARSTGAETAESHRVQFSVVQYYLVAYNVLSCLAWAWILGRCLYHEISGYWEPLSVGLKAQMMSLLRAMNPTAPSLFTPAVFNYLLPKWLHPLTNQASTMYAEVGLEVKIIQTFALLEVVHAMLGLVKSSLATTIMQVASRLILVWGIADHYDQAKENPLYASMVFAWSITEVIRYSWYALNLCDLKISWLTWIRYTFFYVLYPVGAGSEAFVMFSTLPPIVATAQSPRPILEMWMEQPSAFVRLFLFLGWWPSLYVLYNHMRKQRRKVLGSFKAKGRSLKTE